MTVPQDVRACISKGVSAALHHDSAESNIARFNKPSQAMEATTYGFKGFPENYMMHPKRPLRHQPSADVSTSVNRYFRKDSPTEWAPPPNQQHQRMPSPPPGQEAPFKEPEWLQQKRNSPPPAQQEYVHQTISPRYKEEASSHRKPPVIRDPRGEMSSADRRRKIEEHYQAEEDLAMARQRREREKYEKIEEQQKIRELQDSYRPWGRPGGGAPNRIREMQEEFNPYGLPGGGAPTVKALIAEGYEPYGRPGAGAPKADNRKQKFTEHQLFKPTEPNYEHPPGHVCNSDEEQYQYQDAPEMRYGDENRGVDRVRTSMEQRQEMPERKEAFGRAATMPLRTAYSDSFRHRNGLLRQQEREIDELRRNLSHMEHERQFNSPYPEARYEPKNDKMAGRNDKLNEMLHDQSNELRRMQDEIDQLKAHDDLSHRPGDRPSFDHNPRAHSDIPASTQSVAHSPLYMFTAKPNRFHEMNFVGFLFPNGYRDYDDFEPQTERTWKRYNREQGDPSIPSYLNISPRRRPVGALYNANSTYTTDFDPPFVRHGRRNLGNPNKDAYEPYSPFGMEGGGAPMVDDSGKRKTRIAGSMGVLGRELSDSARAKRTFKKDLLTEIGQQAADERARREAEKEYARQGFTEVADVMRGGKVGYPKYERTGQISEHHHLPHMFKTTPYPELTQQRRYHDFLASQIEERNKNTLLGQLEEKRQAREHFRTQDAYYGKRGGGNIKGQDLRKINLERAIHNPQHTLGIPRTDRGFFYVDKLWL